jgi:hypothetical protein
MQVDLTFQIALFIPNLFLINSELSVNYSEISSSDLRSFAGTKIKSDVILALGACQGCLTSSARISSNPVPKIRSPPVKDPSWNSA